MIYSENINNMAKLKSDISDLVGKKIMLKRNLGRDKGYEKLATIEKTYPCLFKVKFEKEEPGESYSYADILTRTVELSVYDGAEFNPLLPPLETKKRKYTIEENLSVIVN